MRSVPAALFLIVAAHGARAEDAEALRKSVVEARAGLARDAGKDGLVEEAIREWQNVLRDDPGNAEATKALAAAPFPGILEWPEPLHRKYLAWNTRRLKTLRELATRAAAALENAFATRLYAEERWVDREAREE